MNRVKRLPRLIALVLIAISASFSATPPKLVLQITVDQLRGDLPKRFMDRMGPGGFRYLYEQGIVYHNAHHNHANTETIVGHTTLATGAPPSIHGMVGNLWFDREKGRIVYNVEDEAYPLLSDDADVDKNTELDPTQKKAKASGRSPSNILVSTFSDELSIYTAGKAKVFGVSVKDRGAISMAGHTGKAYWFSKSSAEFVTSSYYQESYPEWVIQWNADKPTERYLDSSWELLNEQSSYQFGDKDDQEWEINFPGYGRTFPHPYAKSDSKYFKYFTTLLTLSPAGDELTLEFAKALIEHESIGMDAVTDYLSISFSSTDYVGHFFGPSSLEMEDNLLRLDQTIANLLSYVDQTVGLDQTLIVLSADHGGPEAPGYLKSIGIQAEYVDPDQWNKEPGIEALTERFGKGEDLIQKFSNPFLYLDPEVISASGASAEEVQTAIAEQLIKLDGVALAIPRFVIEKGELPDNPITRSIINNHHPKRSGDIYIVFEPHRFINNMDGLKVAVTHGSPWTYDTFVPVIFAGNGLTSKNIYRRIETVDVATTMAAFLNMKPPSGATGNILREVLE